MIKYTPKHQVKVGGKMSEEDVGIVGKRLANSALIIAVYWGLSALIMAIAYFLK